MTLRVRAFLEPEAVLKTSMHEPQHFSSRKWSRHSASETVRIGGSTSTQLVLDRFHA